MSARVVDRIDPFTSKATIKSKKQKRSQGSSHYRTKNAPELQALPQLKGKAVKATSPKLSKNCRDKAKLQYITDFQAD